MMRNFIHRMELEDELYERSMKTIMARNDRNIDPIDMQVSNMLNDEMDANNHMNNISMIGSRYSTFETTPK